MLFETALCELGVPVLYLPNLLGFAEGWLNFLPVQYPYALVALLLCLTAVSALHAVVYRQQQLLPFDSKAKLSECQLWFFWIFVYVFLIFPPPMCSFLLTYTNVASENIYLMPLEAAQIYFAYPERVFVYEIQGNMLVYTQKVFGSTELDPTSGLASPVSKTSSPAQICIFKR
ncbi:unnamed protein product, partial [Mesorhabditis belari]|uniref:Uncharacterized protein n=1 Tax=Mesorhabditis belari TaxID=2138241 RepID=A0AAF3FQ06_9BILA